MDTPSLPREQLQKLFIRRTCWMLADLALALGYALISVRRFLRQIGYYRSYTHNGKWYTLRSSPAFNPPTGFGTTATLAFRNTVV